MAYFAAACFIVGFSAGIGVAVAFDYLYSTFPPMDK